jgi:hypothetical protein
MATNWTVPTVDDLQAYLNVKLVDATNPDSDSGISRADVVLSSVVARVRAAIGAGNWVPLSLTTDSVPPEAKQHVLVLVAAAMMASTPQILQYANSDIFKGQWDAAEKFIKDAQAGEPMTIPTDPDPSATPSSPTWGDYSGEQVGGVAGKIDTTTDSTDGTTT